MNNLYSQIRVCSLLQKVLSKVAWRWDCTGALSWKLIWSRQCPSPAPPQAVMNCKIRCVLCVQREQLAATDSSTAVWKSVVRSQLISPSMCAHPGTCRYKARNVAARRAFALHPQSPSHSSKDCLRTSVLDHGPQRLPACAAWQESCCVTAPTQNAEFASLTQHVSEVCALWK